MLDPSSCVVMYVLCLVSFCTVGLKGHECSRRVFLWYIRATLQFLHLPSSWPTKNGGSTVFDQVLLVIIHPSDTLGFCMLSFKLSFNHLCGVACLFAHLSMMIKPKACHDKLLRLWGCSICLTSCALSCPKLSFLFACPRILIFDLKGYVSPHWCLQQGEFVDIRCVFEVLSLSPRESEMVSLYLSTLKSPCNMLPNRWYKLAAVGCAADDPRLMDNM